MINEILEDMQEQMEWHERIAESNWHKEGSAEQQGHIIAAMSYNRAMQMVRKHAAKAKH
jgi:hypothetical protein